MKRTLLLSVVLSIASLKVLIAQELGIGGRLGINSSTILSEDTDDRNFGFSGGKIDVYIYSMYNRFWGIEGGMMITTEGFKNHGYAEITYFAIPLSARFKFGYFTLNPGIRPSFLMKVGDGNAWKEDFTSGDCVLFISPGVQFPNGITLSSTINVGLTDITDSDYLVGKHTNFSFQFSVGYTFYRK
jgi:hypothetical protein